MIKNFARCTNIALIKAICLQYYNSFYLRDCVHYARVSITQYQRCRVNVFYRLVYSNDPLLYKVAKAFAHLCCKIDENVTIDIVDYDLKAAHFFKRFAALMVDIFVRITTINKRFLISEFIVVKTNVKKKIALKHNCVVCTFIKRIC